MAVNTIFTRYLKELKVPHTAYYSDSMFHGMTFKSLYGLSHLLKTYGIDNEGMRLSDKDELTMMPVPFLAQTKICADGALLKYDSPNIQKSPYP